MAQLVETVLKKRERNDKRFEQIKTQLKQISTSVYELKNREGILPSQVIENPKEGVHDVTLQTGKTTRQAVEQPISQYGESRQLAQA